MIETAYPHYRAVRFTYTDRFVLPAGISEQEEIAQCAIDNGLEVERIELSCNQRVTDISFTVGSFDQAAVNRFRVAIKAKFRQ